MFLLALHSYQKSFDIQIIYLLKLKVYLNHQLHKQIPLVVYNSSKLFQYCSLLKQYLSRHHNCRNSTNQFRNHKPEK